MKEGRTHNVAHSRIEALHRFAAAAQVFSWCVSTFVAVVGRARQGRVQPRVSLSLHLALAEDATGLPA